jgi:STE24 endopeptidase
MLPILAALIYIISWGGDYFFVYAWLFSCIVILVFMTVFPDFIAPIFDKFTPLPDGELRTAIEKLAQSLAFPLTKLYVVENSKRSTHSNAYFYGFYNNKRIVLFDTLLEKGVVPELDSKQDETCTKKTSNDSKPSEETQESGVQESNPDEEQVDAKPGKSDSSEGKNTANKRIGCSTDEILAVLSHELGHWKFNHVLKNVIIVQINLFVSFAAFAVLVNQTTVFEAFGFSKSMQPIIIRLIIVFHFIFQPYNEVLSFFVTQLTRRFEFQADRFAQQLDRAEALQSGLVKINKDNLGFPIADPLYAAFHHSHPSLVERLKALGSRDKQD